MNFDEWFPIYLEITDELGIDRKMDYISSLKLSRYIHRDIKSLSSYYGRRFFVIGNSHSMKDSLSIISNGNVIVADSAIDVYLNYMPYPDIIVSDLDGNISKIMESYDNGSSIFIHAHGDNMGMIEKYAKYFNNGFATTQHVPFNHIYNFGGFSDGDRAAFLADHFCAVEIILLGFDFKNITKKKYYTDYDFERKKLKLKWAKYLLEKLAVKRGKSFSNGEVIEI